MNFQMLILSHVIVLYEIIDYLSSTKYAMDRRVKAFAITQHIAWIYNPGSF